MKPSDLTSALLAWCKLARTVATLPVAELRFDARRDPVRIPETFRTYTRPHPRYKVVGAKSLGAALVDLRDYATPQQYLASVNQKGCAGPQSRKARARGCQLQRISRQAYADQIHAINTSSEMRQGRPMDAHYLARPAQVEMGGHFRDYGVTDAGGHLLAYCTIGIFGNFAATHQLLGYKNKDGVMYFLLAEIIGLLIQEGELEYFMYDTMLGGSTGLRDFKRRTGFRPYRARYSLQR
jgi:hypothetical protein